MAFCIIDNKPACYSICSVLHVIRCFSHIDSGANECIAKSSWSPSEKILKNALDSGQRLHAWLTGLIGAIQGEVGSDHLDGFSLISHKLAQLLAEMR